MKRDIGGGDGFHLFRDGDMWAAVGPHFVDLQQSPAGFGMTKAEAVQALHAELRKVGWPESAMPALIRFKVHDE